MKTKDLFCANCQKITEHSATVDMNGEFVFTCQNVVIPAETEIETDVICGRFLKMPSTVENKAQLDQLIEKHIEANEGQVSLEAQEAKLDELLNGTEKIEPADEKVE